MHWTDRHNPILPPSEKPDWLEYPRELFDLVRSGRMPLIPWHLVAAEWAARDYERFRSHLRRDLVPFAFRQDREDLACFERGKGNEVLIIHDDTDSGYEDEGHYACFAEWMRDVEAEAEDWARPSGRAD